MKKIPWILLFLGLIGCNKEPKLVRLADEANPKTVMIRVMTIMEITNLELNENGLTINKSTQTVEIRGSGVFISPNGHILTVAHLTTTGQMQDMTVCMYDGYCVKGEVLYKEPKLDLALVKVYSASPFYAKVVDPRKVKVGQEVFAVGFPLGDYDWTVTHGIISALHRDLEFYDMAQSDTFINPGNSGGPLFNYNGELVGINSMIAAQNSMSGFTGLGFSVSSGQIREFLTRFKKKVEGL